MISEDEYEELANRELDSLVEALDELDDDNLEAELQNGILTLEFSDGTKFVVNSHRAAKQIWMAADRTAWHFDWTGVQWLAHKTNDELWSTLERAVSSKIAGVALSRPSS